MNVQAWTEREADLFRQFLHESDDLVTVVDRDGRFVYVNSASEEVFGLAPEQCRGRSAWEFVHPEDLEATREAFERWLQEGAGGSFTWANRQVALDGSVRHLHWRIVPDLDQDGTPAGFVSIARDITALKKAELELLRTDARLSAIFSGLLDVLVLIDFEGVVQGVSDSARSVLGWEPADLCGQKINVLMPEPHRSQHDRYLKRYQKTGETWILNTTREFDVVRRDGRIIRCELSVSRIDVPGEKRPFFAGSFRDVTDRMRAQRALAESERRFRAIFDQEFQYVGLLKPDGTLIEINRSAIDRTGVKREEVIGRPFWDTDWWGGSAETRELLRSAVRKAAAGRFVRFEIAVHARDGSERTVDFSLKPLRDERGDVALLIPEGRDITDLKQAQRRETAMLRALASIGESASILAHEIKNPITAVNLALRAVADQLGEDHRVVLEELVGRMQRLEARIRRTLSFTRPLELDPRPFDAAAMLRGAVETLGPEIAQRRVRVEVEAQEGLPELHADRDLIEDVVVNLLRNALDALESGGGRIRLRARRDGDHLEVTVDDDGPGLAESVAGSLFQPFVTSKEHGTGLGLPICRKIVEAHGGTLEAGSSDLGGASFCMLIPLRGAGLPTSA